MVIEPLNDRHNRVAFSCGKSKLDRYLHEVAHQAKRKGLAAVFVAIDPKRPTEILGYYTLSSFMISGLEIPNVLRRQRKLPAHHVGAVLLGRLAVASNMQSKGIGTLLVSDALWRAYSVCGEVAATCVAVDAVDSDGVAFYASLEFVRVDPQNFRLVIMMDTIGVLMGGVLDRSKDAM
jgi:GNAT superfamily N-acetyltransferase